MQLGLARGVALVVIVVAAVAGPAGAQPRPAAAGHAFTVCTVGLGRHDAGLLAAAERGIHYLYGVEVKRLPGRALPRAAFHAPRKRYRAEKLLAYLDAEVVPGSGCDRVMGFTAVDISTTKGSVDDWGILGLATIDGPSGVVSSFRVGRGKVSKRTRLERTIKVMNHELGHALGHPHHAVAGCIMNDAGGTVRTVDQETGLLCDESRRAIEERNQLSLAALAEFDWAAVL